MFAFMLLVIATLRWRTRALHWDWLTAQIPLEPFTWLHITTLASDRLRKDAKSPGNAVCLSSKLMPIPACNESSLQASTNWKLKVIRVTTSSSMASSQSWLRLRKGPHVDLSLSVILDTLFVNYRGMSILVAKLSSTMTVVETYCGLQQVSQHTDDL